jgi:phosphatidylethanolamine-binding protein (PEBP) family uncharacterized protein
MRRQVILGVGVALAAPVLAACGSGGSGGGPVKMAFASPVIKDGTIPAEYTCAGRNISPPLEWGTVPAGTGELALFILGFTKSGLGNHYKATVEWAVAGLSPTLHRLNAGALPAGARLGRASDGRFHYSLCPKGKGTKQFQFELYAVTSADRIPTGFLGLPIAAELADSKSSGPALGHGGFVAIYAAAAGGHTASAG